MPLRATSSAGTPLVGTSDLARRVLLERRAEADHYHKKGTRAHDKHWEDFAAKNLYGIEINDEIARVAKMNMIIHGDGHTNIVCADALSRFERIRNQTDHQGFVRGRFDLVLTNPPFGGRVVLSDRPYVGDYELGRGADAKGTEKPGTAQKSEILFVERIYEFLKPGGRAAIILPDGILTNASLQYVRDFILGRFGLLAVVSLTQTAFAHYGTTVKASVVFLRKRANDEESKDNEEVFMAAPELIGRDATGRTTGSDLQKVVDQYSAFEGDSRPFFV